MNLAQFVVEYVQCRTAAIDDIFGCEIGGDMRLKLALFLTFLAIQSAPVMAWPDLKDYLAQAKTPVSSTDQCKLDADFARRVAESRSRGVAAYELRDQVRDDAVAKAIIDSVYQGSEYVPGDAADRIYNECAVRREEQTREASVAQAGNKQAINVGGTDLLLYNFGRVLPPFVLGACFVIAILLLRSLVRLIGKGGKGGAGNRDEKNS